MTNPAMTTFSLMSLAAPSSGFNGKDGILFLIPFLLDGRFQRISTIPLVC